MGPGEYETLKRVLLAVAPISREGWHILIGVSLVAVFALWALAIRRPYPAIAAVITALGLAGTLEAVDFAEDMIRLGYAHVRDSVLDVALTALAPGVAAAATVFRPDGGAPAATLRFALMIWRRPPGLRAWRKARGLAGQETSA